MYLFYGNEGLAYMYVGAYMHAVHQRPGDHVGISGTGVREGCDIAVCAGSEPGPT